MQDPRILGITISGDAGSVIHEIHEMSKIPGLRDWGQCEHGVETSTETQSAVSALGLDRGPEGQRLRMQQQPERA